MVNWIKKTFFKKYYYRRNMKRVPKEYHPGEYVRFKKKR